VVDLNVLGCYDDSLVIWIVCDDSQLICLVLLHCNFGFLHLSFVVLLMDWYSWHTMASIVVAVLSKMVTGISRLYRIGSRITWLALLVSVFISLMVRPSLRSCTFLLNVILSNFCSHGCDLDSPWPTLFFECHVIKNFGLSSLIYFFVLNLKLIGRLQWLDIVAIGFLSVFGRCLWAFIFHWMILVIFDLACATAWGLTSSGRLEDVLGTSLGAPLYRFI